MRNFKISALLFAIVCISSVVSATTVLYEQNFDSYVEGSNMNGQGGWADWSGPSGAGGIVDWVGSVDSDNILNIAGGSDLVYDGWDFTSGVISFNIKQYIPSTSTGTTYCILLNEHIASPDWAMELAFDLNAGTVKDDIDSSLGAFSILTDQWARIRADINLDNNTVNVYYEGTLIRSGQWSGASVQLTTVDLYANGAGTVYYDDVVINSVPEPATLAILGFGCLAVLRGRK